MQEKSSRLHISSISWIIAIIACAVYCKENYFGVCRYSDGDLTLIYPDGSICSTGFQRMTIINFECNPEAGEWRSWWKRKELHCDVRRLLSCTFSPLTPDLWFSGNGQPEFTGESDCTYYFDWQTAYACVKEKEDLLCRVTDHKKRYDLSPLTRFPGLLKLRNDLLYRCDQMYTILSFSFWNFNVSVF